MDLHDIASPSRAGSPTTRAFVDFESASRAVLRYLRDYLPLQLWAVTRKVGPEWVLLSTDDAGYGVEDGATFAWQDTFCSRMVRGLGPRVAPDAREVDVYAAAPVGQAAPIRAYVGIPLRDEVGALLGTLCAIDPEPQPALGEHHQPLLELLAGLLAGYLSNELALQDAARRAERAEVEASTDHLTGLLNRRGWEALVAAEEQRCRRLGDPACVLLVDVDGLKAVNDQHGHEVGDRLLADLADALRRGLGQNDVVARLGGDEFAALLVDCDESAGQRIAARLRDDLSRAGIAASVGFAPRDRVRGIEATLASADRSMYQRKAPLPIDSSGGAAP